MAGSASPKNLKAPPPGSAGASASSSEAPTNAAAPAAAPTPVTKYYAIKTSSTLNGPAIFFNEQDYNTHILDPANNTAAGAAKLQNKTFERITEAMKWVFGDSKTTSIASLLPPAPPAYVPINSASPAAYAAWRFPPAVAQAPAPAAPRGRGRPRKNAAPPPYVPAAPPPVVFPVGMHPKSVDYHSRIGAFPMIAPYPQPIPPPPAPAEKKKAGPKKMLDPNNKTIVVCYPPPGSTPAASQNNEETAAAAEADNENNNDGGGDDENENVVDTSTTKVRVVGTRGATCKERMAHKTSKIPGVQEIYSNWDQKFAEYSVRLEQWKDAEGTVYVPRFDKRPDDQAKYGSLDKWVELVCRQLLYYDKNDGNPKKTALSEEQANKLRELGIAISKEGYQLGYGQYVSKEKYEELKATFNDTFEDYCQRLGAFKDQFGHADVATSVKMKELYGDLGEWSNMVKAEVKKFEHRPETSFMTQEQVTHVLDMGLNLKPAMVKAKDEDWDKMYEQLKQFAHDNGHTRVPTSPPSLLSRWVEDQRKAYKNMKEGKVTVLTAERISMLQRIGFELGKSQRRRRFDENSVLWLEYYTKHQSDPPNNDGNPENRRMYSWCRKVREKYWDIKAGKTNNLTQEQIDKLTMWGFDWKTPDTYKQVVQKAPAKTWDERYQELVEYKERHGHVNVPQKEPGLGSWIHRQRKAYSEYVRGKTKMISQVRVDKLNALGMVWLTRKRPNSSIGAQPASAAKRPRQQDNYSSSSEDEDEPPLMSRQRYPHNQDRNSTAAPWERYQPNRY